MVTLGLPCATTDLNIPASTAASWRKTDFSDLVRIPGSPKCDIDLLRRFLQDAPGQRLYHFYSRITDLFHEVMGPIKKMREVWANSKAKVLKNISDLKDSLGLKRTLRLFGLSVAQYYSWAQAKTCEFSPLQQCQRRFPGQLAVTQVKAIKNLLEAPMDFNWPLISVYFKGLKSKVLTCGRSAFYKYAKLLGYSRSVPRHRRKNHATGLRAIIPNQFWHADVTLYRPIDSTRVYIYFLIDNFSRYILSWRASLTLSAQLCIENIRAAFELTTNTPNPIQLMVDGGPENSAIPLAFNPQDITRLVAQKDILFSNSLAEAVNKQMKYRYLFPKRLPDFEAVLHHLKFSVHDYNHVRPHGQLHGLTPAEAYSGMNNPKEDFENQINKALAERRIRPNLNFCQNC